MIICFCSDTEAILLMLTGQIQALLSINQVQDKIATKQWVDQS